MDENKLKVNTRIPYLDFLRIIATFAVITIHVSGSKFVNVEPMSFSWQVYNFYNGISRWCVPVFVMISGALFLNKDIKLEKLFKKNILRIVTAFAFWSVAYGIFDMIIKNISVKLAIGEMIAGHYHMWFLFMIAGLYLAVPLLKKITESSKLTAYFLILSMFFSVIIPNITDLVSLFSESIGNTLTGIFNNIAFKTASGFSGYFVLGYFLSNIEIDKKKRKLIYVLGILGFVGAVGLSSGLSVLMNKQVGVFNGYFSVTVFFESAALFVLFKYNSFKHSEKLSDRLNTLSKYTFGVYLVHPMVLELLGKLGLNVWSFNTALSIPVLMIIAAIISFALSAIMNHLPVLKKYIV